MRYSLRSCDLFDRRREKYVQFLIKALVIVFGRGIVDLELGWFCCSYSARSHHFVGLRETERPYANHMAIEFIKALLEISKTVIDASKKPCRCC